MPTQRAAAPNLWNLFRKRSCSQKPSLQFLVFFHPLYPDFFCCRLHWLKNMHLTQLFCTESTFVFKKKTLIHLLSSFLLEYHRINRLMRSWLVYYLPAFRAKFSLNFVTHIPPRGLRRVAVWKFYLLLLICGLDDHYQLYRLYCICCSL